VVLREDGQVLVTDGGGDGDRVPGPAVSMAAWIDSPGLTTLVVAACTGPALTTSSSSVAAVMAMDRVDRVMRRLPVG
jgi:hypothetical protein